MVFQCFLRVPGPPGDHFWSQKRFQKQPKRRKRFLERQNGSQIASRALLGSLRGRKKSLGTSKGALGEISSEISSKNKPGYHGTGSAFEARAASKASETRARRSQRTLQAETAKKHQEEQEPPRAGQQEHRDSEPGHATVASRRRCAPPPRRLELGAFPRVFLRFSRGFPARSRRSLGKITGRSDTRRPKKPKQTKKNSREQPPTQPLVYFKSLQKRSKKRSKIEPKWLQNRSPEPPGGGKNKERNMKSFFWPPGGLPNRSRRPPEPKKNSW